MVQDALRKRILSLIGLARKGGMITTGTNLVEGDLRRGTGDGWVALVARDASEDIADRIRERLRSSGTSTWTLFTKADLGDAVGKSPRSVLLIKDQGLGEAVMETINRYLAVMNKGGKAV
jgi:ribosomal protein L7Ae-like RNA K-turn-binding protein